MLSQHQKKDHYHYGQTAAPESYVLDPFLNPIPDTTTPSIQEGEGVISAGTQTTEYFSLYGGPGRVAREKKANRYCDATDGFGCSLKKDHETDSADSLWKTESGGSNEAPSSPVRNASGYLDRTPRSPFQAIPPPPPAPYPPVVEAIPPPVEGLTMAYEKLDESSRSEQNSSENSTPLDELDDEQRDIRLAERELKKVIAAAKASTTKPKKASDNMSWNEDDIRLQVTGDQYFIQEMDEDGSEPRSSEKLRSATNNYAFPNGNQFSAYGGTGGTHSGTMRNPTQGFVRKKYAHLGLVSRCLVMIADGLRDASNLSSTQLLTRPFEHLLFNPLARVIQPIRRFLTPYLYPWLRPVWKSLTAIHKNHIEEKSWEGAQKSIRFMIPSVSPKSPKEHDSVPVGPLSREPLATPHNLEYSAPPGWDPARFEEFVTRVSLSLHSKGSHTGTEKWIKTSF